MVYVNNCLDFSENYFLSIIIDQEQTKFLYEVDVGCQYDQITAGQMQSGHTDNQLPPHKRILFD